MQESIHEIQIYTDGSYDCNHKIGCWCAIIIYNGTVIKEINKNEIDVDCSQIELFPIVESINYCLENIPTSKITIFSDCRSITDICNRKKFENKKSDSFTYKNNKKIFNSLFSDMKKVDINFKWVNRRSMFYAEMCDTTCRTNLRNYRKKFIKNKVEKIFDNFFNKNISSDNIKQIFFKYLGEDNTNPNKFNQFIIDNYDNFN